MIEKKTTINQNSDLLEDQLYTGGRQDETDFMQLSLGEVDADCRQQRSLSSVIARFTNRLRGHSVSPRHGKAEREAGRPRKTNNKPQFPLIKKLCNFVELGNLDGLSMRARGVISLSLIHI